MKLRKIRSTIRGPLILFVTGLVLVVALLVLWNVVLAVDYQHIRELTTKAEEAGAAFHWTFIALGSAFFVAIIALFSVLGAQLFGEIRFNQRLGGFVATFTHELNSPLASIKLFAQTLKRTDLSRDERERFLDLILSDVERLHGQIANVLRSAQVDSPHGLQLAPEATPLADYLADYVGTRQAAAERLEREVQVRLAEGPAASARVDRQAFRQALDNLVDNAIKYSPAGRPCRVELALVELPPQGERPRVAVEVRDDGIGIPAGELDRIFDRFRRVERADAPRRQGTGLGLWIVQAIALAHDGQVEALSPGPGEGATFRIILPREEGRPHPVPQPEPAEASS